MGIQSCADEVIEELAKEYQAGYDFAFDKHNLPADHELGVAVQKPDSESEEEEDEEEDCELLAALKANQKVLDSLDETADQSAGGVC